MAYWSFSPHIAHANHSAEPVRIPQRLLSRASRRRTKTRRSQQLHKSSQNLLSRQRSKNRPFRTAQQTRHIQRPSTKTRRTRKASRHNRPTRKSHNLLLIIRRIQRRNPLKTQVPTRKTRHRKQQSTHPCPRRSRNHQRKIPRLRHLPGGRSSPIPNAILGSKKERHNQAIARRPNRRITPNPKRNETSTTKHRPKTNPKTRPPTLPQSRPNKTT